MSLIENLLKKAYRTYLKKKRDPHSLALKEWYEILGDHSLRFDYDLNKDSKVVDLGGHVGYFSHTLVSMYNPYIFIFEPVIKHYELLKKQFRNNSKIKVFNSAVSDHTGIGKISLGGIGSSMNKVVGEKYENIQILNMTELFRINNLEEVDLLKMNIEGEEYKVLNKMIKNDLIKKCKNIQIQFHLINKNSVRAREDIRKELSKTHELTFDYYFVLENWRRKEN